MRIEQTHEEVVPLHVDATTDPAWRSAVVCGFDLDAPIQVHHPDAKAVMAKRLDRERSECGLFLGKLAAT